MERQVLAVSGNKAADVELLYTVLDCLHPVELLPNTVCLARLEGLGCRCGCSLVHVGATLSQNSKRLNRQAWHGGNAWAEKHLAKQTSTQIICRYRLDQGSSNSSWKGSFQKAFDQLQAPPQLALEAPAVARGVHACYLRQRRGHASGSK